MWLFRPKDSERRRIVEDRAKHVLRSQSEEYSIKAIYNITIGRIIELVLI